MILKTHYHLELQRLHEEAKTISDNDDWTFLKRTEDVELWKKSYGKSAVNMVKVKE